MTFLSLLDDRARPKGSRDPLGFEMVWTWFGRRVVGNLTTVTSSWRIFAVGLLGFHWCNKLCRDNPLIKDRQQVMQEHFIRYEQLAAYLRSSAGDDEIMGITRVRRRLNEEHRTVNIGIEQQNLILSDQVSYGIWGLYSTALRETGLVQGNFRELTDRGLELVHLIEENLNHNGKGLGIDWYWGFLRGDRKSVSVADLEHEGKQFVGAISAPQVKDALIVALLTGSGQHRCQLALYEACKDVPSSILEKDDVSLLIAAISNKTKSPELGQALDDVSRIERLLVAGNVLFNYMRRKNGEPLIGLVETIDQVCNFKYLQTKLDLTNVPYGTDLGRLWSFLQGGKTLEALRCLLDMNKKIMAARGGAAWVEEAGDGKLRVRVKAETALLPKQEELKSLWHYDYFLRSYARIAATAGQ